MNTIPLQQIPLQEPAIAPKRYFNRQWEKWGTLAFILALLLLLLGLIMQAIEITRISNGVYNYGLKNMDFNQHPNFQVVGVNNGFFLYAEPWHFWPWTYAGLFFGLLLTITGLAGILSALRRSYSLIFTFFIFSLLSLLESIFLIIYYSIIINYYYRYYTNLVPGAELWRPANRPDSGDRSFGLVGTQLALSILALLLSFLAMIYSAIAGRICTRRKSFLTFYGQPKYTAHTAASLAPAY